MERELRITPPEGYEIDREASTFDCIKFKKVEDKPWEYDGNTKIKGYFITSNSTIAATPTSIIAKSFNTEDNKNIFATLQQAKSALAMAQISQIMVHDSRYGGPVTDEEWNNEDITKFYINNYRNSLTFDCAFCSHYFLAFHTSKQRELFLKDHEDLVRDYLMID